MVEWDKDGNVSAESIHQYGTATLNEDSPHYNDQAILFSNMEMKPSFIKLDDIKNNLRNQYKP